MREPPTKSDRTFGVVQRGPDHFVLHCRRAGEKAPRVLAVSTSAKALLVVMRRLQDRERATAGKKR